MGGVAMEEMPLSALFEEARKIHLAASESRADQVGKLLYLFIRIRLNIYEMGSLVLHIGVI